MTYSQKQMLAQPTVAELNPTWFDGLEELPNPAYIRVTDAVNKRSVN